MALSDCKRSPAKAGVQEPARAANSPHQKIGLRRLDPGLRRGTNASISQHDVREAVAVACLIGVAAAVHVGQIEAADGAERVGDGEE